MSCLSDLRGQTCETEQEILRQTIDTKMAMRASVERQQRIIAEKRGQLESEVEVAEAELEAMKANCQGVQADLEQRQQEAPSVIDRLPEIEEARAAVSEVKSRLEAVRQQGAEEEVAHQARLDENRSIYQMYAASTGIRWDYDSENVAGCVALGMPKHFDLGPEVTLPGTGSEASGPEKTASASAQVRMAEKLWTEVEAALPKPGHADEPPWDMSRTGGA